MRSRAPKGIASHRPLGAHHEHLVGAVAQDRPPSLVREWRRIDIDAQNALGFEVEPLWVRWFEKRSRKSCAITAADRESARSCARARVR